VRARGGGLDELHQYTAGITRVHEVDPRVRGPAARLGVEQPHALLQVDRVLPARLQRVEEVLAG